MSAALDAVDSYAWDDSADDLEKLMRKYYPQLLQLSYEAAGIDFDLTNPRVQDKIDDLAKKVRNIPDTTREQIKGWVKAGVDGGQHPTEIARQIRKDGVEISKSRSVTIARTESREAYNGGALLAYDDAGVTKVRALDSDNDPECEERNGTVYTLEEAADVEAHPNCVLAWEPIVE